jgi:hypothetical protein
MPGMRYYGCAGLPSRGARAENRKVTAMIPGEEFQKIYDNCRMLGFDFEVALRTRLRDGKPWYVPIGTVR